MRTVWSSRLVVPLVGVALVLGACGGGEVNLNVATVDNSVDNSTSNGGGGSSNPCAVPVASRLAATGIAALRPAPGADLRR